MTRYYFSCEGAQTFEDGEGTELADDHCAMMQAILNAGEVLTDHVSAFSKTPYWRMTVSDASGRVAFRLHFTIEQ
jgi:hypothetical protein